MSAAFSAVIVARNEEALVERCLESVTWCDEHIVVDMDSADRTRERAARLATKIVDHEWIPHMEWARNRGIELATGEWILVVDADEVITGLYPDRLHSHPEIAAVSGLAGLVSACSSPSIASRSRPRRGRPPAAAATETRRLGGCARGRDCSGRGTATACAGSGRGGGPHEDVRGAGRRGAGAPPAERPLCMRTTT